MGKNNDQRKVESFVRKVVNYFSISFMKYIPVIALLVVSHVALAQQIVNVNNDNQTISFKEILYNVGGQNVVKYVDYKEGSPYFKESWMPASLVLNNGKSYEGLQAKLDIMSGGFVYKNETGVELVAQAPIKQITFTEGNERYVFVNSSTIVPNGSKKIWYQQLQTGGVSLYKQVEKIVVETTPFNSATVERSIKTTEKYFLVKGYAVTPLKKTKDLFEALDDRPDLTQKFAKEKQSPSDKTFIEIVSYYNSLSKQQ
jgi:hypothetical protein